jgi:hypothetical protein
LKADFFAHFCRDEKIVITIGRIIICGKKYIGKKTKCAKELGYVYA